MHDEIFTTWLRSYGVIGREETRALAAINTILDDLTHLLKLPGLAPEYKTPIQRLIERWEAVRRLIAEAAPAAELPEAA